MASDNQSRCDIVVIGGSAGCIEPLKCLVSGLPADLSAAVFVVVHLSPDFPSHLDQIVDSCGPLRAVSPTEKQPIQPGMIYVAPPDLHLLIEDGYVDVSRGPRENRHRPAIDPLFRSAAREYGARVAAVVLSGHLDDGSSGLMAVKMRGGLAIVQDTSEALYPEMPRKAKAYADANYELPVAQISELLAKTCANGTRAKVLSREEQMDKQIGSEAEKASLHTDANRDKVGNPSEFACPECHGVMWETEDGKLLRFRCRVGHSYTADALRMALSDSMEEALWAAMRALEEKASLLRKLSPRVGERVGNEYTRDAKFLDKHVETIRKMLIRNQEWEIEEHKKASGA
jgi:two-component system chemotaxis response regulator CheB